MGRLWIGIGLLLALLAIGIGMLAAGSLFFREISENLEQAVERCGTKQGNKGFSAMQAAIETVNVLKGLK
mgnify:CR=1 FL=1